MPTTCFGPTSAVFSFLTSFTCVRPRFLDMIRFYFPGTAIYKNSMSTPAELHGEEYIFTQ